jgi:hypothetical protein
LPAAPARRTTPGGKKQAIGAARRPRNDLGIVRLADVKPERVEWLWHGRIPRGKLTILEGDPKVGKSTLAIDVAARVTTGTAFPDGYVPEVGSVLLLTAEDGLADTVRPRLDAAGADAGRVHAWESVAVDGGDGNPGGIRPPSLPQDIDALESLIVRYGVALVIVDVLNAYLGAAVDGHKDQDVRRALMPLAKLAENTRTAILVLRHLNKSQGGSALYRGGGSIGIAGAARSILLVAVDPDDKDRRVLVSQGTNIAAEPEALVYELGSVPDLGCARVRWLGTSTHTSESLLATTSHEERGALTDARRFVVNLMANGSVRAQDAKKLGEQEGIKGRTLDRARDVEGVTLRRDGFGKGAVVWWDPPADARQPLSASHGEYGDGEHDATEAEQGLCLNDEMLPVHTRQVPVLGGCGETSHHIRTPSDAPAPVNHVRIAQ